ncbi:MAG: cupin domain-containing protein [Syntrophorhabdaceae bacterium]|nr:cupin domain-containing protein [Syntrophorhabdaceae bacterium]
MREGIIREDPSKEFYFKEGCYIIEQYNTPLDPKISIARARVEPGKKTRWHRLKDTTERYYILNGTGMVEIGPLPPTEVKPGDLIVIPPMCPQRIKNTGNDDLVFLAICTPRFIYENYEDVEDFPF